MLGQSKTCYQAEIDAACELIDFLNFNAHFAENIHRAAAICSRDVEPPEARGLEGFVYAITPFNFTAIAVNLPAAPALMGCSVVETITDFYVIVMVMHEGPRRSCFKRCHQHGPGDPKTGSEVLTHPDMSGIHFTGSTATFNYLWKEVSTVSTNTKPTQESLVRQVEKTSFVTQRQTLMRLQQHL